MLIAAFRSTADRGVARHTAHEVAGLVVDEALQPPFLRAHRTTSATLTGMVWVICYKRIHLATLWDRSTNRATVARCGST